MDHSFEAVCGCSPDLVLIFYHEDRRVARVGYFQNNLAWYSGEWPGCGRLTFESNTAVTGWLSQNGYLSSEEVREMRRLAWERHEQGRIE